MRYFAVFLSLLIAAVIMISCDPAEEEKNDFTVETTVETHVQTIASYDAITPVKTMEKTK